MPQCGFSFECGQKAPHHITCKANYLLNAHIPDSGLISRAERHHGASERTKVASLDRNNNCSKAVSQKNSSTQKGTFTVLANGPAAGRFRGPDVPGYAAPNGAARFGPVAPCYRPEQTAPGSNFSASEKKQRGNKHFRNKKKRDKYMTSPRSYKPLLTPLQEKEDWDEEIKEVTLKNREKMNVVTMPYGPEDVLHFSMQDLTLRQSDSADQPAAGNYSPAVHHARPTQWSCCCTFPESEQFADAE